MNRSTFEYFIIALILGLGTPIFAIWGALDGEKLALVAYPSPKAEAVSPGIDYPSVLIANETNIARGRKIFQLNCVSCHGENGDGMGPAAKALTPPPRNFLDPQAKWTRGRQPADLFTIISKGSAGTGMAGFSAMLKPEDRWAIVHYLGTLPGIKGQFVPVTDSQIENLKTLSGW